MSETGASTTPTHPLLARIVLDRRPVEMHYEATLDARAGAVRDHRIYDTPVVPAAAYIDVALAAAEQMAQRAGAAHLRIGFHDLLAVAGEDTVVVRTWVRRTGEGLIDFAVESAPRSESRMQAWRRHATGEVRISASETRKGVAGGRDSAPTMARESGEAFYERAAGGPFQWGVPHRVVREVYRSPTKIEYRLRMVPPPDATAGRWLSAALVDGCLQVPALELSDRDGASVSVPASIDNLIVQRSSPASLTVQWVHEGEPEAATTDRGATLTAYDKTGVEVVRFEGVQFRSITRDAFMRALAARSGTTTRNGTGGEPQARTAAGSGLRQQLAAARESERLALLTGFIERNVVELLKLKDPTPEELQRGFFSIGLDSLLAIELQFRIQKALDFTLPQSTGLNLETPDGLAKYLLAEVLSLDEAPKPTSG